MDDRTAKAWNEAARHVLQRIPRDTEAEEDDADAGPWFDPETFGVRVASVRRKVPYRGASLAHVTQAAAGVLAPGATGRLSRTEARAVKAVVVGYAFATYAGDMLPVHERGEAARLLGSMMHAGVRDADTMSSSMRRHADAAAEALPRHGSNVVSFGFTWRQAGRRGRPLANVRGTGDALLSEVSARDAPVVARLATPGGGRLDLRTVGGILHRPVMSPGSWRPIDRDAFAAAASAGTPWRDNPFAAYHADAYGPVQGAGEHWPLEGDALTPDDVGRRQAALEYSLSHAGRLVLVDGTAYRATTPPRLVVALTSGAVAGSRDGPHLAWAFPEGPRSDVSQTTLAPFGNWPLGGCVAPWLPRSETDMAVSFPLGSGRAAEAFLEELLPALEHWNGKAVNAPASPAEVVDADAFPDNGEALNEAVEEMRALMDRRVAGMPRDFPYFDEAEALAPADREGLAVPKGWREDKDGRTWRVAVATVAALANSRRMAGFGDQAEWSSFRP